MWCRSFSRLLSPNDASSSKRVASINNSSDKKDRLDKFRVNATQTWLSEILPNWGKGSRYWRNTQDMWWYGIPPKVRGTVWKLSIGNELGITEDLYKYANYVCFYQHEMLIILFQNLFRPRGMCLSAYKL